MTGRFFLIAALSALCAGCYKTDRPQEERSDTLSLCSTDGEGYIGAVSEPGFSGRHGYLLRTPGMDRLCSAMRAQP